MKKIIGVLIIAAATGCNQPKADAPATKIETIAAKKDTAINRFANLSFDSKKDLSCGMPVSAGVADTVHYKGKLYGFCSTECKEDFLKDPEAHLKAQ